MYSAGLHGDFYNLDTVLPQLNNNIIIMPVWYMPLKLTLQVLLSHNSQAVQMM